MSLEDTMNGSLLACESERWPVRLCHWRYVSEEVLKMGKFTLIKC